MKILLISRGYPTNDNPQWGCFEKDQAEALKALGHDVTVFCLDCRFSFRPSVPKIKEIIINGIKYYSFNGLPQVIVARLFGTKSAINIKKWMFSKLYKRLIGNGWKPDVVYSHFVGNSAAATVLKEKFGLPLVLIEHASDLVKDQLTNIIKAQAQEAYTKADQLITVSNYLQRNILEKFNIDSIVIPNMLGEEFLAVPPSNSQSSGDRLKFISIGALIPRKGFKELIEALAKAHLPSNWELVIIGKGELKRDLEIMAQDLRLNDHIKFLGSKSKSEIIQEMSTSDVFVLNTKNETFGVVYIEALSQGLPCIATRCGGAEGIVDSRDGLNVAVDNEKELIVALEYMAAHHKEFDREYIRDKCLKRYSPEIVVKKIESVLQNSIHK